MVDAIIIARDISIKEDSVEVELSKGVRITISPKFDIPKECIGPLMITISDGKVNIIKIAGPCSLWSKLEVKQ